MEQVIKSVSQIKRVNIYYVITGLPEYYKKAYFSEVTLEKEEVYRQKTAAALLFQPIP